MRSLTEMAEEFGITKAQLRGYLANHPFTGSSMQHISTKYATQTWYRPKELRAWWVGVKANPPKQIKKPRKKKVMAEV